jgi:hypothetical protein
LFGDPSMTHSDQGLKFSLMLYTIITLLLTASASMSDAMTTQLKMTLN